MALARARLPVTEVVCLRVHNLLCDRYFLVLSELMNVPIVILHAVVHAPLRLVARPVKGRSAAAFVHFFLFFFFFSFTRVSCDCLRLLVVSITHVVQSPLTPNSTAANKENQNINYQSSAHSFIIISIIYK